MKLLFVFCCLSAGFIIFTEANPFFFKTFIPQNIQIQRQPAVSQGVNFGFGSIISKWFPSIVVTKQFGTRRPKATQRPVIEVTTVFEPVDLEKEDVSTSTTEAPAEIIDVYNETSSETPIDEVDKIEENSSTTTSTTTEEPIEEIFNYSEDKTTTTTTTTTEEPFEEIYNYSEDKSTTTTTTTTEEPLEEINNYTEEKTTSTTTAVPFEELEPFTESKTTTTTTELPFEETEPFTNSYSSKTTTTTTEAPEPFTEIKTTSTTTTTTERPVEVTKPFTVSKYQSTASYEPFTESKTSTTTEELSINENESSKTTTNAEAIINQIGFTTEGYTSSSTSAEVIQPSIEYLPSGSDKGETAAIKPTTYRPPYVPTTLRPTTTNAPWKETPTNLINTGGFVDYNKTPDSYVYVRPDISVDDILFNEVSPNARPFQSVSLIGTKSNGKQVEQIYQPLVNERPRVTFYSNY